MTSGVMYRVGEGNKPELMQTSKGMFMVPGEKGRMFSNKEVTGGAQPIKRHRQVVNTLAREAALEPTIMTLKQAETEAPLRTFRSLFRIITEVM